MNVRTLTLLTLYLSILQTQHAHHKAQAQSRMCKSPWGYVLEDYKAELGVKRWTCVY